ncbi:MAG: hypothetical protein AB8B50_12115 [Pirellulaceae bacterium]
MQLDRTQIEIRQRSGLELFDLSLVVLRQHFWPIVLTSLLLGLPLLLIDLACIRWIFSKDAFFAVENLESPEAALYQRHAAHLIALFCVQFPLMSLPTTIMLGNIVFYQPLRFKDLLGRLRPIAWRSIFVLGILRFGLVTLVLEPFVSSQVAFHWATELFILALLPILALLIRSVAPFGPEVLGLELCPLWKKKGEPIVTYRQRSRRLHYTLAGEHMGRMLGTVLACVLLGAMLLGIQMFFVGATTGLWQWGATISWVCLPITLWAIGVFLSVVRFLSYLDSRIRLEGWEIELHMRAEADRLTGKRHIETGSHVATPPDAVSRKGLAGQDAPSNAAAKEEVVT